MKGPTASLWQPRSPRSCVQDIVGLVTGTRRTECIGDESLRIRLGNGQQLDLPIDLNPVGEYNIEIYARGMLQEYASKVDNMRNICT